MISGTVKFFNADKGFGFIQPDDGSSDAYVHISAVEAAGMRTLDRDQRVSYELQQDNRGRNSAVNIHAELSVKTASPDPSGEAFFMRCPVRRQASVSPLELGRQWLLC